MIRKVTALGVFIELVDELGKLPSKDEFMSRGFSRATYYRTKNNYYEYVKARLAEKQEGGNPVATYEDDVAEGFIKE